MLLIRDGWGVRDAVEGNAVAAASIPYTQHLLATYPHTLLDAHGHAVGLTGEAIGSSEVGHLNMGAGRVVKQVEVRISDAIVTGDFFKNEAFLKAIDHAVKHNSALHLMGLVQDAGVHAHQDHLFALLKLACRFLPKNRILIHAFTDGRDTPPRSAHQYLELLHGYTFMYPSTIASLTGRYYAMDRDKRWERTQIAYDGIVHAKGGRFPSWEEALEQAYATGEDDEFITPKIIGDYTGVHDNDAIIFFNFRLDRPRQLTQMFREASFPGVEQVHRDYLDNIFYVAMTLYYDGINATIAFPNQQMESLFGEVLSSLGMRQLRVSETEKYAHVTYFFNGQREEPYPGEDRILIPSDRSVATYDKAPTMKVHQVARAVVDHLDGYDVIIVNLVNADMVGHTGVFEATVKALEETDKAIALIVEEVRKRGGLVFITADHGNAEEMLQADGSPKTAHTTNPVHLIMVDDSARFGLRQGLGKLADVAPTVLTRMGIAVPEQMDGDILLVTCQD